MRWRHRDSNRLSAVAVAKERRPGLYPDGGGLYLRVIEGGAKSWVFRFKRDRRERRMGLGSFRTWSLAEARDRAREARQLLDQVEPVDPIEQRKLTRQQAKEQAARVITFEECANLYIKSHSPGWKNKKHAWQWENTLQKHAYPIIGGLPVNVIDTALVLKVLEPIWHDIPETASRLRGRIENVLGWATVRKHRSGDNPATWRGHLQHMLPSARKLRPVKHHPAMPYTAVADFIADIRKRVGVSPRALEFTILTATRTSEAIGARWSEIDLVDKVWKIPAERMKVAAPHRVPLCARAIEILEAMAAEAALLAKAFPDSASDYVFAASAGAPLSNMAMLELLQGIHPELTVHGFRSSFRDWAGECTNFPREVAEAALAHEVGDDVEAAYLRGDFFRKRTQLMDAWARYCGRPVAVAGAVAQGNVLPIGRGA